MPIMQDDNVTPIHGFYGFEVVICAADHEDIFLYFTGDNPSARHVRIRLQSAKAFMYSRTGLNQSGYIYEWTNAGLPTIIDSYRPRGYDENTFVTSGPSAASRMLTDKL